MAGAGFKLLKMLCSRVHGLVASPFRHASSLQGRLQSMDMGRRLQDSMDRAKH